MIEIVPPDPIIKQLMIGGFVIMIIGFGLLIMSMVSDKMRTMFIGFGIGIVGISLIIIGLSISLTSETDHTWNQFKEASCAEQKRFLDENESWRSDRFMKEYWLQCTHGQEYWER